MLNVCKSTQNNPQTKVLVQEFYNSDNLLSKVENDSSEIRTYEKLRSDALPIILSRFNRYHFAQLIEAHTGYNFSIEKANSLTDKPTQARILNRKGLSFFNNGGKSKLSDGNPYGVAMQILGIFGKPNGSEMERICDLLAKYANIDRSVYVEVKEKPQYASKRKISRSKRNKSKTSNYLKSAKTRKIGYHESRLLPFFEHLGFNKKMNTLPSGQNAIYKNRFGEPSFRYLEIVGDELEQMKIISKGIEIDFERKRLLGEAVKKYGKYLSSKIDGLGVGVRAYLTPLYQCFINPKTKRFEAKFKHLFIGEGEYKTLAVNLLGLPKIGLGGVNSGTILYNKEGQTKKEWQKVQADSEGLTVEQWKEKYAQQNKEGFTEKQWEEKFKKSKKTPKFIPVYVKRNKEGFTKKQWQKVQADSEGLTVEQWKEKFKDVKESSKFVSVPYSFPKFVSESSDFLPEILLFIEAYQPERMTFMVDNDFLENEGDKSRAGAFKSSFKWLTYAAEKHNISFEIAYPNFNREKGIDDLIFANIDQKETIAEELKAVVPNGVYFEGEFITKRLIHDVDNPSQTSFRLLNIIALIKRSVDGVRFDDYLTSGKTKDLVFNDFDSATIDNPVLVPPPTGSGKTEISNLFKSEKKKGGFGGSIFDCSPTVLGNEAKTGEYSNKENNHSGVELKIFQYDQTADSKEKEMYGHDIKPNVDSTNTCFPSQASLVAKGEVRENDLMFIDEAHKLIVNFIIIGSFVVNMIMNARCRKILTTATPFDSFNKAYNVTVKPYFRLNNATVLFTGITLDNKALMLQKEAVLVEKLNRLKKECEEKTGKKLEKAIERRGKIKAQIEAIRKGKILSNSECNDLYLTAAKVGIDSTDNQDGKIHIVFINNKEHIKYLEDYAKSKGFDTDIMWGGDERLKDTDFWKVITKAKDAPSKKIPIREGCNSKFIFFTSVGYELINILNENIGKVYIFGERWVENVMQAVGRFRRMKELEVLYFLGADHEKKPFYQKWEQHLGDWRKSYDVAKEMIEDKDSMFWFAASEKDRKRYHRQISTKIKNDVSAIMCDDGTFNLAGCVYAYENKKQLLETNRQKLDRLAESFFVESRALDITELGHYLKADTDIKQVQGEVKEYQLERKERKESAAEMANGLFQENAIFSLMLVAENTSSPIHQKKISDFLGIDSIKESCFASWKDEKRVQGDELSNFTRVEKQELGRCAKRVLSVASKVEDLTETNIKRIGECVGRKEGKKLENHIHTVQLLDVSKGLLKNPKDALNKAVYELVIEKLEVGEMYSNNELKEVVNEVYSKFRHKGFKAPLNLISCLFDTSNVRLSRDGKQVRGKLLNRLIDKEYIKEKFGVSIDLEALTVGNVYDLAVKSFSFKEHYTIDEIQRTVERLVGGYGGNDKVKFKIIGEVADRLIVEEFEEINIGGNVAYKFLAVNVINSILILAVSSFRLGVYTIDQILEVVEKLVGGYDGNDKAKFNIIGRVADRLIAEEFKEKIIEGKTCYLFSDASRL